MSTTKGDRRSVDLTACIYDFRKMKIISSLAYGLLLLVKFFKCNLFEFPIVESKNLNKKWLTNHLQYAVLKLMYRRTYLIAFPKSTYYKTYINSLNLIYNRQSIYIWRQMWNAHLNFFQTIFLFIICDII